MAVATEIGQGDIGRQLHFDSTDIVTGRCGTHLAALIVISTRHTIRDRIARRAAEWQGMGHRPTTIVGERRIDDVGKGDGLTSPLSAVCCVEDASTATQTERGDDESDI